MVFRGNVTLTAPVQDSSTVTSKHSEASLDKCPERNLSAKHWCSGHRKVLALSVLPVGDIVWLIMYEQQSMRTANQLTQLLEPCCVVEPCMAERMAFWKVTMRLCDARVQFLRSVVSHSVDRL